MMRDENYRRAVATLPCARCGLHHRSQTAHSNSHLFGKGGGMKAGDYATFPLCADAPGMLGCHSKHDRLMDYSREEAEELEKMWIIGTFAQLLAQGIIKVDMRKIPT